jgi:rubrerythrin
MVTLEQVFDEFQQREKEITRLNLSPSEIKMLESGEMQINSENYSVNNDSQKCIANLAGCPVEFFKAVPVDLQSTIANRLLRISRVEKISISIHKEKEVIGFSNADLITLPGTEVLETAFDVMPDSSKSDLEQLVVRKFICGSDTLELDITTPRSSVEIKVGDIVSAGISIYHSSSGIFATQISTFLYRLVCTNGLLIPICQNDKRLKIRRLDISRFSKDDMLENIRRISKIAWEELDIKLQAFANLSKDNVDPEAILADLANRMHLNRKLTKALHDALYEDEFGFDSSRISSIHALSRVATHYPELNSMFRRRLMEASGILSQEKIHRCSKCGSIVYGREAA